LDHVIIIIGEKQPDCGLKSCRSKWLQDHFHVILPLKGIQVLRILEMLENRVL
jgi:hypothetical protein